MINNPHITRAIRAALLGAATTAVSSVAAAQDQESAVSEMQEVVVTGSRIARPELEGNSPVAVYTQEDFKLAGISNVEEYMRDIPQVVQAVGANNNNGNPGVATIDLRNMGEERTLVLVDGKRFVPYDSDGFVDLSMIPSSLVERVEVLTGGASAIYGSDAVAGVVNFITRKNFQGIELDVQYGSTTESDAKSRDISLTVGGNFAEDQGNAVLNLTFTDQDELTMAERDFSFFALGRRGLQPRGSFTDDDGKIAGSFPALCTPTEIADGECFADFATNGNLTGVDSTFNFNPFNLLQVPQKKWTATALGNYEINQNVEAFARATLANSRVTTIIAPTGTFFFPFTVNLDNPFLTAQARLTLTDANGDGRPDAAFDANNDGVIDAGATTDISFGRRLVEIGTRDSVYENTAYQVVTGLRGEAFSNRWEAFAQQGRTNRTLNFVNDVSFARAQQAMLAVRDSSGNIRCQNTSGGCVPANFFGSGNISAAAADFISLDLVQFDTTNQFVAGGSISSELPFKLPTTSLSPAYAFGVESRREKSTAKPDENLVLGNSIGFGAASPINAEYKVREAFVEIGVPILQDKPLARSLSLDGAFRYGEYENSVTGTAGNEFDNETWKVGGEWTPVEGVRLRGNIQRVVRAPNVTEIGLPLTFGTGNLTTDPCAGLLSAKSAALQAQCIATGVPGGNPGIVVPGPIVGQINNFSGGNPALDPETADTWTVGLVLTPTFLPSFALTVDYYSIDLEDAITAISEQNIVNACYGTGGGTQDTSFCSRIRRSALTGGLVGGLDAGVDVSLINAAFQKVKGVDVEASYKLGTESWGAFQFRLRGTRVLENLNQDASTLPEFTCDGEAGPVCDRPDHKTRFIQTTQWSRGPIAVNLQWQYLSGIVRDTFDARATTNRIPAYSYFDLAGSYDLGENVTIRAGITNLTDKEPPIVGSDWGTTTENSANSYPATYDHLGRSFFLGVTAKF